MPSKDLTAFAQEGFSAPEAASCPHLFSSPAHYAWSVGRWLALTGRSAPRNVRMSRGDTIRANDMLLSVKDPDKIERLQ